MIGKLFLQLRPVIEGIVYQLLIAHESWVPVWKGWPGVGASGHFLQFWVDWLCYKSIYLKDIFDAIVVPLTLAQGMVIDSSLDKGVHANQKDLLKILQEIRKTVKKFASWLNIKDVKLGCKINFFSPFLELQSKNYIQVWCFRPA